MLDARVVLVNYRTAGRVRQRVSALRAAGAERPAEIVVVDNDPGGGLAGQLPEGAPDLVYLDQRKNTGFAAAVNRGMAGLERPAAILLNPDAEPQPGCLAGLLAALEAHPRSAVAAPGLWPADGGPARPCATRRDPSWRTLLAEYGPFGRAGRHWLGRHYFLGADAGTRTQYCATVQGACFAVRRAAWEQVGAFDADRFFLYWEETDFCRRARAAGWHILFCPGLNCRHEGGASIEQGDQQTAAFWRSAKAYFRKHRGPGYARLVCATVSLCTRADLAVFGLSNRLQPARRARKAPYLALLRERRRALAALRAKEERCAR